MRASLPIPVAVAAMATATAMCATNSWTGAGGSAWSTPASWSGGSVPSATDVARFDNDPPPVGQPHLGAAANVGTLLLQAGNWTLSSSRGGGFGTLTMTVILLY